MTNKNPQSTKSGQSQQSPTPKPTTPRPAPSQGQTVSKGGKNK